MKKFNVSGAVSNTALSKFNLKEGGSPKSFKLFIEGWREEISSPSMDIGNLIHKYYEDPTIIHKLEFVKPTDSIKKWADDYLSIIKSDDFPLEKREEAILESKSRTGVFSNIKKKETILTKFEEANDYLSYLLDKENNKDKVIVSSSEFGHLQNAIASVSENELASKLLTGGNKEFSFIFEKFGIKIKAIIDNLIVDDDDKKIYITDIKTTMCGCHEIVNYFSERNYDRQLSLYREGVLSLMKTNKNIPNYPIECSIVNISLRESKAIVYKFSEESLEIGKKKHDDLLLEIKKHIEIDEWNKTIEENKKGFIEL